MENVYLLLGSNLGDSIKNLESACNLIGQSCGKITARSSLYRTGAWGLKEQPDFLNQAINISTPVQPIPLLALLKNIEKQLGREETVQWGPRIIDIDILFYGETILDTPQLQIPHPAITERRFTLEPMNEIAPAFIHPVLQTSIAQLLANCKDQSPVIKLPELKNPVQ